MQVRELPPCTGADTLGRNARNYGYFLVGELFEVAQQQNLAIDIGQ